MFAPVRVNIYRNTGSRKPDSVDVPVSVKCIVRDEIFTF